MEGNKLEISGHVTADPPPSSYKKISESEEPAERPKSLTKSLKSNVNMDGADEEMLPKEEKNESKVDIADIKFTTNEKQNGEAKLDIVEMKTAFVGMSKEELMKYANDPYWVRLRWILFISFWLLWLAMLVGAIIIIIAAPKCAPPTPRTWFEEGPLTEVNANLADVDFLKLKENKIKGIIVKNVDHTYSPANESTDIINFIQSAKKLEINVIVELEPTTTFLWLNKSINQEDKYSDYYIWAKYKNNDAGIPEPPNNWISQNGESSWLYSEKRDEFYYAPNGAPHLNFRRNDVIEEFSSVIRQWIDVGANGIRLKGAPGLLVDESFRDEAISNIPGPVHTDYSFYNHERTTIHVEGVGEVLKYWRNIIREHTDNTGPLMIAEDLHSLDVYFVNETLSFDLPRISKLFYSADKLKNVSVMYHSLNSTFSVLKDNWPLWQYNNSMKSLPTDVLNILIMLLPGSSLISQDVNINPELLKIREVPSIMFGATHFQVLENDTVFAYSRTAAGNPGYLVAFNPTQESVKVDFTAMNNVSDEVTVQVLSAKYSNMTSDNPKMEQNLKISAKEVPIPPKSALVLTYVPKSV